MPRKLSHTFPPLDHIKQLRLPSIVSILVISMLLLNLVPLLSQNTLCAAEDTDNESDSQAVIDVIDRYGMLWENADAHTAEVWRVRWSPDSTRVVSASFDNTAVVFDAQTGKELLKLEGHSEKVRIAEYSPDGTRIATGSDDKTVKIWDSQTGSLLETWEDSQGAVLFLNWSYDGSKIAGCSGFDIGGIDEGKGAEILVWDTATGDVLFKIDYHQDDIFEVSFSPDGTMIASSSDDREIGVWDAETGEQIKILSGSLSGVLSVQWSPDGTRLSTGSRYHWLRIWDTTSWEEIGTFADPTEHCIRTSSWSRDMTVLLTTGTSNEIVVWDPTDGTVLRQLPGPVTTRCAGDYIISVQFSPDNKYFAYGTSMAHSVRVFGLGGIGNSDPAPNAEEVPVTTKITITSNIALDGGSINGDTFELYDQNGKLVEGELTYHENSLTILFVPDDPLEHGTQYNVVLSGDVLDASGEPLGLDYSFSFRTEPSPEASKEYEEDETFLNAVANNALKVSLGIVIIILIIVLIALLIRKSKRLDW
ncbi:MAG: Ig-like domain-containing protein [Thermoplasmata archaeon]|nr:MAG: Ig-like domain-containing protein [Thermoplasmata archaeon]